MSLLWAVALGGVALAAAGRLGWLTASGTLAAAIVGLAVVLGCGWLGVLLLLVFFLSASALTRFRADRKVTEREGGGRSASQVLANGGVAAALSLVALAGWVPAAHYGLVGAGAGATADTWATEIGSTGAWPTWSVIGGRVPPGRSGGVSLPGTLSGMLGAVLIGGIAGLLVSSSEGGGAADPLAGPTARWIWLASLSGTAGMFADSVLGATLEDRLHLLGNDEVNVGCTLVGAVVAWATGIALW